MDIDISIYYIGFKSLLIETQVSILFQTHKKKYILEKYMEGKLLIKDRFYSEVFQIKTNFNNNSIYANKATLGLG